MCASGVADFSRNARPISIGTDGRNETEWAADLKRNQWPNWAGIRIPPGYFDPASDSE